MQGVEPELEYDTLRNSVHVFGRDQQNCTPPPTYEEVLSMLNMSRYESSANNINNVNNADGNSGHNTNDVGKNLNNVTYLSLSNLANITSNPNISASQNDSDISMPDIGGSQPSCMENINEED
ncbi:12118_t:CDS:2 [Cetraspora pellucida]|uniref:12118_t:CDS:1 n=1 Tax=Cetraspora pellucida TaxID=1433469 RepID=A0A9N9AT57_9GLOM|nr:12118_t:CDS:2 [Cetraspora pellucida]